jgi:hypothetical protein
MESLQEGWRSWLHGLTLESEIVETASRGEAMHLLGCYIAALTASYRADYGPENNGFLALLAPRVLRLR